MMSSNCLKSKTDMHCALHFVAVYPGTEMSYTGKTTVHFTDITHCCNAKNKAGERQCHPKTIKKGEEATDTQ